MTTQKRTKEAVEFEKLVDRYLRGEVAFEKVHEAGLKAEAASNAPTCSSTTRRVWRPLPGDWRSGAHGANRRAHLFVYHLGRTKKLPACHAQVNPATYGRRITTGENACYDCLAYGASGR